MTEAPTTTTSHSSGDANAIARQEPDRKPGAIPDAAPAASETPAAAKDGRRIRALDVLRGIAILGTLGTNIFVWAQTGAMLASDGAMPGAATGGTPLESMLSQLTNGKFLSLLTIMFGIGLTIQFDAAERRNQRWPAVYIWRAVLLFLDGLLHYVLVFMFDVLMAYAVTGMIVAYILLTTKAVQRVIFGIAAAVHMAFISLPMFGIPLPFLGSYGQVGGARGEGARFEGLEGIDPSRIISPAELEGIDPSRIIDLGEARGGIPDLMGSQSWWDGVVGRFNDFIGGREEAIFILPMTIALFLLGSFLYRAGLFEARGRRLRITLMVIGAVAFVYDMLGAAIPEIAPPGMLGRYFVPIFVAPALAAAAAAFYLDREPGWVGRRLEDVGRLALSTYVGQNLVSMLLFSDWALNLDAKLPKELGFAGIVICYLLVALIIIVFATVWRRFFKQGPLEWLWGVSYRGAMKLTPSFGRPKRQVAAA